jgi:hypothetical protein
MEQPHDVDSAALNDPSAAADCSADVIPLTKAPAFAKPSTDGSTTTSSKLTPAVPSRRRVAVAGSCCSDLRAAKVVAKFLTTPGARGSIPARWPTKAGSTVLDVTSLADSTLRVSPTFTMTIVLMVG